MTGGGAIKRGMLPNWILLRSNMHEEIQHKTNLTPAKFKINTTYKKIDTQLVKIEHQFLGWALKINDLLRACGQHAQGNKTSQKNLFIEKRERKNPKKELHPTTLFMCSLRVWDSLDLTGCLCQHSQWPSRAFFTDDVLTYPGAKDSWNKIYKSQNLACKMQRAIAESALTHCT